MQSDPNRYGRTSCHFGYFGMTQAPEAAQKEHLSLGGREPQHGPFESLKQLPGLHQSGRGVSWIFHRLQDVPGIGLGDSAALARVVDDEVPRNSEEPRPERRGRPVGLTGIKHPQEGLLEEVFGQLAIADEAEQEVEQAPAVAVVEDFKGGRASSLYLLHQGFVRGRVF